MAILSTYLDYLSRNNKFLKPFCLEARGRYVIEILLQPYLYFYTVYVFKMGIYLCYLGRLGVTPACRMLIMVRL